MKKPGLFFSRLPLLFATVFIATCGSSGQIENQQPMPLDPDAQIDEYVVHVFEDKKGNLWFGTLSAGAARFDGKTLTYFSTKDGLCGNAVVDFAEDKSGNLWLATQSGLSRFDGKAFTNFTKADGLRNDAISNILVDRNDQLWVGTWGGVFRFNGIGFIAFDLPKPDIELPANPSTSNWITEIIEDQQGNLWFGRDGYGACKFDGSAFTHFTKKDGLASNNVQVIRADRRGNIWFGSRVAENDRPDANSRTGDGGLSRFDGKTIVRFPEIRGLSKNETYAIAEDRAGNIWVGANGLGVYRFDGTDFTLFEGTDRMDLTPHIGVQSILEDRRGTVWFGLSGGLFRLKDSKIVNVKRGGPWP